MKQTHNTALPADVSNALSEVLNFAVDQADENDPIQDHVRTIDQWLNTESAEKLAAR